MKKITLGQALEMADKEGWNMEASHNGIVIKRMNGSFIKERIEVTLPTWALKALDDLAKKAFEDGKIIGRGELQREICSTLGIRQ